MANTDNGIITRLENRLARLGKAKDTLDDVRMRLRQIERRAPQLKIIAEGAYNDLDEALEWIDREWEETRKERGLVKE